MAEHSCVTNGSILFDLHNNDHIYFKNSECLHLEVHDINVRIIVKETTNWNIRKRKREREQKTVRDRERQKERHTQEEIPILPLDFAKSR